jgi:hypothetical protein
MKNSTKLKFAFSFLFTCIVIFGFSQRRFVVHNTNSIKVYEYIDSVFANLQSNDLIYLPGGSFTLPTGIIDKSNVTIIGAGHNPNNTQATERTYLNGSLSITSGGVTLKGFYLNGSINVASSTSNVSNFKIYQCSVYDLILYGTLGSPKVGYLEVEQCVIRDDFNGGYITSALIRNNYIEDEVKNFNGSSVIFKNNHFDKIGYYHATGPNDRYSLAFVDNCFFYKNIFGSGLSTSYSQVVFSGCSNNTFYDCAFLGSPSTPDTSVVIGSNTLYDSEGVLTFSGGSLPSSYDYNFSYSISPSGNYGMYGGIGYTSLPNNPHINTSTISTTVDVNSNLNIIIDVSARNQ